MQTGKESCSVHAENNSGRSDDRDPAVGMARVVGWSGCDADGEGRDGWCPPVVPCVARRD